MSKKKIISRGLATIVIVLSAWFITAYARQGSIHREMTDVVKSHHLDARVEVLLMPLLINPLRDDPTVNLYIAGMMRDSSQSAIH